MRKKPRQRAERKDKIRVVNEINFSGCFENTFFHPNRDQGPCGGKESTNTAKKKQINYRAHVFARERLKCKTTGAQEKKETDIKRVRELSANRGEVRRAIFLKCR